MSTATTSTITLTGDTETALTIPEVIDLLLDAAAKSGTVLIAYAHPRNGVTARVIRPRTVILDKGIVRAWDAVRDDWRSFKLDGIRSIDTVN